MNVAELPQFKLNYEGLTPGNSENDTDFLGEF